MRNVILIFLLTFSFFTNFFAQTGCPDCMTDLPEGMPADTLFLGTPIDGQVGITYDSDLSFRLPITTTTVAEIDSTIPPGIGINRIVINGLSNLPPGLSWEVNQETFTPADLNDGCVKICGTPQQPGLYYVQVGITAEIFVVSQESSFSFPIYIAPEVSFTDGFSMENSSGCGNTTVHFQNNIPSNGVEGFNYTWDFGNGTTSLDENPAPQFYNEIGLHEVNYEVIIDTAGYFLKTIIVENVGCTDIFGEVDMSARVTAPDGTVVFVSEIIAETNAPVTFNLNLPIQEGNYILEIIDDDSGINGGDDNCGTISFNQLSSGALVAGDLEVILMINHPVEIIQAIDTVIVYPSPDTPEIIIDGTAAFCEGDMTTLTTSLEMGFQWYQDTLPLVGENTPSLTVNTQALYSIVYTDENGCSAVSEATTITVYSPPPPPEILINGSLNSCLEGLTLTSSYFDGIQWYINNTLLVGENEPVLLVTSPGQYQVSYTDENGCISFSEVVNIPLPEVLEFPILENNNNLLVATHSMLSDPVFEVQWYFEGQIIPNETNDMYCAESSGIYSFEMTNLTTACLVSNEIEVTYNEDFANCTSSTDDIFEVVNDFKIYPNPATTDVTIRFDLSEKTMIQLRLVNVLGQMVYQFSEEVARENFEQQIMVADLAKGVYFLEIGFGEFRTVRSIVVE